ncbi:Uncharacterized RNA methyltransferase TTE1812 [Coccomyxa sp. Obi]|nr:Uncharacterized RNA methyltransferase TTE1812 [Coccomyxa sp. Obi]
MPSTSASQQSTAQQRRPAVVAGQQLRAGHEIDLICESLAFGGQGVCKLPDGFTIFCDRALPGEHLCARITTVKKTHASAVKVAVSKPHNHAVAPPCVHYAQGCGGCSMQNLAYTAQLAAKEQQVVDALARIGKVDDARSLVKPVVPCEQPFRYRNKMAFTFAPQQVALPSGLPGPAGFGLHHISNPREVLPVWGCWLQDETANRILQIITAAVQAQQGTQELPQLKPWVKRKGLKQQVEKVTIRSGLDPKTRERAYMVILHNSLPSVYRPKRRERLAEEEEEEAECRTKEGKLKKISRRRPKGLVGLVDLLHHEVPQIAAIYRCTEPGVDKEDATDSLVLVSSTEADSKYRAKLVEDICGLDFVITPLSFFQTNPAQTEKLYNIVADAAGFSGDRSEVLLDLYSGTGTIALCLASQCKEVYGVESYWRAVNDAKENARSNGIHNACFVKADLSENYGMANVAKRVPRPDIVIADPARAGLGEPVIEYLLGCGARTLVYVSCNPATQARDIQLLTHGAEQNSFRLESVQPVDMFPHTEHIESVALLRRS